MQFFRFVFNAMASHCELMLPARTEAEAREQADRAMNEVHRIEHKYSRYQTETIVSRINAEAGKDWVECDDETVSLLNYADVLYENSDGLFDITSGVLRRVWNFKEAIVPTQSQLDEVLPLIGWNMVERNNHDIRLPQAGMQIDFGGYGKEYAADRAAAVLEGMGVTHGYVNLGGDMRVLGPKLDGQPWVMGIQNPRDKNDVFASIPIERGALATSGDYERYFEIDGKRYCHVFNPKTGWPVTYWQSVSVLAPMAVTAGSITSIAMLKEEAGLTFLQDSNLAYLGIDQQGQLHKAEKQT